SFTMTSSCGHFRVVTLADAEALDCNDPVIRKYCTAISLSLALYDVGLLL
ncbi:hypothetical protein NDU88_002728, partial [Pleurodeles waltl]